MKPKDKTLFIEDFPELKTEDWDDDLMDWELACEVGLAPKLFEVISSEETYALR